nr:hypothetical protein GCM10020063_009670 [Dactylosporangium thailandense]
MNVHLSRPLGYLAVAACLRSKILSGEYPSGSRLPAERDLCHLLSCGLDTVRQALTVLRRELLITTVRGYRSEVVAPPERVAIMLTPGDVVTAWMPMLPEALDDGIPPEMPVLTAVGADGNSTRYPASYANLIAPPATRSGAAT